MKKIGLLTCSNVTQTMGCTMTGCLMSAADADGPFAAHREAGGGQLMGVVTCAGCPTAVGPGRILERVRGLVKMGAEALHLSRCMLTICPFVRKYESLLKESFPGLEVIRGTHGGMPGMTEEQVDQAFKGMASCLLTQERKTLPDAMTETMAAMTV